VLLSAPSLAAFHYWLPYCCPLLLISVTHLLRTLERLFLTLPRLPFPRSRIKMFQSLTTVKIAMATIRRAMISRRTSRRRTRRPCRSSASTRTAAATSRRCRRRWTPFPARARRGASCGSTRASTCKRSTPLPLCYSRSLLNYTRAERIEAALCCSEKVTVPSSKPYITFQGQGFELTAIAWNDTAKSVNSTFRSASVAVFAAGFVAKNISFMVAS
jgi:hypothetical protein